MLKSNSVLEAIKTPTTKTTTKKVVKKVVTRKPLTKAQKEISKKTQGVKALVARMQYANT